MSGRRLTIAGCCVLAGAFALTMWVQPWSDQRITDLNVFGSYAHSFLHGRLPYRDVPFEYPPLAAAALALPGLIGTGFDEYQWAFAALMLVAGWCVIALVRSLAARTGGDERLAVAAVALAPLVTGAMIRNHFDLLPVALTLGALVLVVTGRTVPGFAVLGLAVMTKAFPLVVAPVALAWLAGRGDGRAALRGAVALAAVVAAVGAASLALSPSGSLDSVRYQTGRPVQVESLAAFGLRAVGALGGARPVPVHSHGSDNLEHPAAGAFSALSAALGAGALALLCAGAWRRRDPRSLVLGSLGAVAAVATFNKVLSPQYLVWVLPLGALALAWRRFALAGAIGAATLLTFVEFPSRYLDLVDRRAFPVTVIGVRDAALVLAVALAVRELWPAAARREARARDAARPAPG